MKKFSLKSIIIFCALAFCSLLCFLAWVFTGNILESQKAAERWGGDSELVFRQFSVFLPESGAVSVDSIYEFRSKLQTEMTEVALETPENGSLFCDAWSASGKLTVSGENGSGEASVIAVGGSYFHFHPLTLISGSYISENDIMKDRILLDEDMAWLLFGGTDLVGMTVTINNIPYVVAGVISREDDRASESTYTGGAGLYMSFEAFNAMTEQGVSCYEIVMPEPVDGFGASVLEEDFSIGEGEITENSGRFSFSNELKILGAFGTRSMRTGSVSYPYWENAARYYEDWCALFLLLGMLLAVAPLILLLAVLYRLLRMGKSAVAARLPAAASKAVENVQYRIFSRKSSRGCNMKKEGGGKHGKRYAQKH